MAKEKIVRFLLCGAIAGAVYFIFFQTPIVSKWGIMPGQSFSEIDSQTWLALHIKWLTFNKFAGYYWVALFMACAFGILSDGSSKSDKWNFQKSESCVSKTTAEVYKYKNNINGPELQYKNNFEIQAPSVIDK